MNESARYIPGVCNIGRAEIRKRQMAGMIGSIMTVLTAAGLIAFNAPVSWRLLVFIPAFVAAIGYLQAAWHFCVAFGLMGLFNVSFSSGESDTVDQAEYRREDRAKALKIAATATLIAGAVAVGFALLPIQPGG